MRLSYKMCVLCNRCDTLFGNHKEIQDNNLNTKFCEYQRTDFKQTKCFRIRCSRFLRIFI